METMKLSQNKVLLKYFKSGKKLTALGALDKFGVGNLSARITDLKQAGYDVKSRYITVKNIFNEDVRVKQYWM